MPLSSQLSLSIELTRLLPAAGIATIAAGGAIIKMARDLRKSGSDIVVEEDVAAVFSQVIIAADFEAAFRSAITKVANFSTIENLLPVGLQSGPGPTVQRALKHPHYMPMVIQLSLLAAAHDLESLAEGLSEAMRLRTKDHVTGEEQPYVSSNSLKDLLKVCLEQTSGFQWAPLLMEVESKMDLPKYYWPRVATHPTDVDAADIYQALAVPILQASLDMLAAVQRLYEDSFMVIESCKGVSTMVVWAHHVLGLTVQVTGTPNGTILFGNGTPSVIINFPPPDNGRSLFTRDSIVYLMNASGDVLLTVQSDKETATEITAERRCPVEGYALHAFQRDVALLNPSAVADMCNYSAALAKIYANRMWIGERNSESTELNMRSLVHREPELNEATQLLIGREAYNKKHIETYQTSLVGLDEEDMPPPASLHHLMEPQIDWERIRDLARSTALVILAFSAVGDLTRCQGLILTDLICTMRLPPLAPLRNLPSATEPIVVNSREWYDIICSLLGGRKARFNYHETCLYSGWGWSVFMDSFADCDPFDTVSGKIWIQRGVPCHDGAVADFVWDGPCTIDTLKAAKVEGFNDFFEPRSAFPVTAARSIVAHRDNAFVVCKRYKNHDTIGTSAAVGYEQLAASRFLAHTVEPCGHTPSSVPEHLQLGLGMSTVKGFTFSEHPSSPDEKVCICLSYGDKNARWLALVGVREIQLDSLKRTPVLRGLDTCVSCFLKKGVTFEGNLLLIL